MGRGRGRGRGKANVTATPIASPTYPVACTETVYDGVGDFYNSSAAAFKDTGPQTFVGEFWFDTGAQDGGLFSNNPSGATTSGVQTFYQNSTNRLYFNLMAGGSWKTIGFATVTENQWNTFCITFDATDGTYWYNGSSIGS